MFQIHSYFSSQIFNIGIFGKFPQKHGTYERDIEPLISVIILLWKFLGLPMTTVCMCARDLLSGVWSPALPIWTLSLYNLPIFYCTCMYYQPTELNALLFYVPVIAYMEQLALLRTSKPFQLILMCTCLSHIHSTRLAVC